MSLHFVASLLSLQRDSFRFARVLSFLGRTGRPCEAQRENAKVSFSPPVPTSPCGAFSFRNRKAPSWGDKAKPPISYRRLCCVIRDLRHAHVIPDFFVTCASGNAERLSS
jgi:hypothetical protein